MKIVELKKQASRTKEEIWETIQDEYLGKLYNTYAKDYNSANSKVYTLNHLMTIYDELQKRYTQCEHNVSNSLNTSVNEIAALLIQYNIDGLDDLQFKSIFKIKEEGQEGYFLIKEALQETLLHSKLHQHFYILRAVIDDILMKDYPKSILLWDKFSECEKARFRGNPNFKKTEIPDGFYEEVDELYENFPEKSKSWKVKKLLKKFYENDTSKESTVYRRLTEYLG